MRPYDVLIIGAGPNGLAAAAYLAKGGQRVLVLERREEVGGAMSSREMVPGYQFQLAAQDAGWLAPAIVRELDLGRHGLELLRPDPVAVAPLEGGGALRLLGDSVRTAAEIARLSARDAGKWSSFTALIARFAGFLEQVYQATPPTVTPTTLGEMFELLLLGRRMRGLGRAEMMELLRTLPISVAELLDDWFESEPLKGLIGSAGVTGIMQGPRSGGTSFNLFHHHVGQPDGAVRSRAIVKGGVGRLTSALAAAARAAGAEIRTRAQVRQILVRDDGQVAGVVLDHGEEIRATRVASSADPRRTMLGLLDAAHLDPELARAVGNIKMRGIRATMSFALGELPRIPGVSDADLAGALVVAPSLDYLERAYDDAKYGAPSRRPYLEVRFPTLHDPSLAPAGRHVMSVVVQYVPYRLAQGEWDDARREALGDVVLGTLAELAPNLPGAVVDRRVLTPKYLEEEYALTEGNGYHGELTLDQILFMRPVAGLASYRGPVDGLYLCGAGTHPGGGITAMSGRLAARAILEDARR